MKTANYYIIGRGGAVVSIDILDGGRRTQTAVIETHWPRFEALATIVNTSDEDDDDEDDDTSDEEY